MSFRFSIKTFVSTEMEGYTIPVAEISKRCLLLRRQRDIEIRRKRKAHDFFQFFRRFIAICQAPLLVKLLIFLFSHNFPAFQSRLILAIDNSDNVLILE